MNPANIKQQRFAALRAAYPGRRLLIVSNTAGATSYDVNGKLASEVEKATGVTVLAHRVKKPGCGHEIMSYFREHPETGVTSPAQIAIVGDRLATDMMLANMMGSWGFWVKDGVVPLHQKSIVSRMNARQLPECHRYADPRRQKFSRMERKLGPYLLSRGYSAPNPTSPFE